MTTARLPHVVAVAIAVGWTVAALLAGGFFPSTLGALTLAAVSGLLLVAAFRGLSRPSVCVVALGLLALWTTVSFFWNGTNSLRATLLPLLYAASLWLAEQGDRRTSLTVLRIAILLVALAALVGRAVGLAPTAGGSSDRLQWPVTYANGLGLIAATGVLLWLALPARRPWGARAAAAACALVTVLTFSRGAVIGLVIGLAALLVVAGRVPRRSAVVAAVVVVATALLAGPAILSHFSAPSPDSRDVRRLFDLNGHGRGRIWREAWRKGASHPLVGIGPGSFRSRIGGSSAHSLELQTFVDLGVVGLLGLAAFLVGGLHAVRGSPIAAGVFVLWLVVASIDWVWQLPACTIPALVATGATVRRVG